MFFLLATTNTLAFYFQSRVQGISTTWNTISSILSMSQETLRPKKSPKIHRNALFIVLWVARGGQGSKKQMIWTQVEAI